MNAINKVLLSMDQLSPAFEIRYRNKTKYKSMIGSLCTVILAVLLVGLGVFLGRDMFLRLNPNTRINKVAAPENKLHLKDTVMPLFLLANGQLNPSKFHEEFDVTINLSYVDMNSAMVMKSFYLELEACKEEDFVNFHSIRTELGMAFPAARCINTETVRDSNGQLVDRDVAINGNMGGQNSAFITTSVRRKEGRSGELTGIYSISYAVPNIFVDNSNYENPTVIEGVSVAASVELSLSKQTVVTLTKDTISSDTGLLFESISKQDFISFQSKENEYFPIKSGNETYVSFIFTSLDNHSVFEREYIKLPTVIAEVFGIGKAFYLIFKFVMGEVSFYLFYLENIDVKGKNYTHSDQSTEAIKPKTTFDPPKPSFFAYLFTRKAKFNLKYPATKTILAKFDIEEVNKEIANLKETILREPRIEFRQLNS